MSKALEKEILSNFTLPLRYDPAGNFIYDANMQMVGNIIGWGFMTKFKDYTGAQTTRLVKCL